ncbi:MAG: hypothetical protein ACRDOK_25725, partial [Streptosporangiaceae bacterium]
ATPVTRLKDRHNELVRGALAELVTFVLLDRGRCGRARKRHRQQNRLRRRRAGADPFRGVPQGTARSPDGEAQRLAHIAGELEKIESPDFWLNVEAHAGTQVPAMRPVRTNVEAWLASLDYEGQIQRGDQEQQARHERATGDMPGLDASPIERARYLAAHPRSEPPVFQGSGDGWPLRISAHPRPADARGPGQFTVGLRAAGEAHIETTDGLEQAIRSKLGSSGGPPTEPP